MTLPMLKKRFIFAIIATLVLVIPGVYAIFDFFAPGPLPPAFSSIKAGYCRSEAILLDRHGDPLHELRMDPRGRRLEWVPLARVSPALIKAVIQSEDRRFYRHRGVEWQALGGAFLNRLRSAGQAPSPCSSPENLPRGRRSGRRKRR